MSVTVLDRRKSEKSYCAIRSAPIPGFEGLYEIFENGKVRRIDTGRFIQPRVATVGYLVVSLWKNNKGTTKYIHRLLAEAFIPNPHSFPTVNHIDGDKTNNDLNNLEWASYGRNNKHAYETGLKVVSAKMMAHARRLPAISRAKNPHGANAKPVLHFDLNGSFLGRFPSVISASRTLGMHRSTIYRVLTRKRKAAKGHVFIYEEAQGNG